MPMRPSSVRITGSWNATPNASTSVIISDRYSPTLGSSSIAASPSLPGCCMLQREAHQHRQHQEIDHQRAEHEEDRRRDQIRQERLALVAIKAGRDEHVDLRRHHRKRQERRAEHRELELRDEIFEQRGVDELRILRPGDPARRARPARCRSAWRRRSTATNITAKASSALISRERSSIRCSINGALVASMSSWVMHRVPPTSGSATALSRERCRGGSDGAKSFSVGGGGSSRQRHVDRRQRAAGSFTPSVRPPTRRRRASAVSTRRAGRSATVSILERHRRSKRASSMSLLRVGDADRSWRCRGLRHVVGLLLEVGHLGFAHRFLELALEFVGHAADLAHPLADRAQHARQFLRPDRDQRDDADDDESRPSRYRTWKFNSNAAQHARRAATPHAAVPR